MSDTRTDPMLDRLVRLSDISAPPGHEQAIVAAVTAELRALGVDVRQDRLGQVSAHFGPGDGAPLLITAHVDEVALVLRTVDEHGWGRVLRVGGVPERLLQGTSVGFRARGSVVPAVIGSKAHHLTPPGEKYQVPAAEGLYVDFGVSSRTEVESLGLRVGDMACYRRGAVLLPGRAVAAPALDDRSGVAALLTLAERLTHAPPPHPVVLAFTTQEEFHVRGTLALVAHHKPSAVVNVDVSPATDTPDLAGTGSVRLGGGPVLNRYSFHGRGTLGGLIPHPGMADAVEDAASAADVPLQVEAIVGLITDAAFVPMATGAGVATVGLGIPCRYTHSPVEQVRVDDVDRCADLLDALARRLSVRDLDW